MHDDFLPVDGIAQLNKNTQIKVRLRKDQEKLKLEIIDHFDNINNFYGNLNTHFDIYGEWYNITFIGCHTNYPYSCEIMYSHYIEYCCFNPSEDKNTKRFIDMQTKRQELCFRIENLKLWLYPKYNMNYDNLWSYTDKKGNKIKLKKDAEFIKIKVVNKSNEYSFLYQGNKFKLSIIDELQSNFLKYPEVKLFPNCYIKLSSDNEYSVRFLYRMILKIQKLFSLFFNQVAQLTSIFESKRFDYFIKYDILEQISKPDIFMPNFNIYFDDIKQNLGDVLEKWFKIYDEYELVISTICSYQNSNFLSNEISKKAQLLETIGNIITKGANTRKDIKEALLQLGEDNINRIFLQDRIINDFDIRALGSNSEDQISILSQQIMNLRNHATHPYKSGKLKTASDDNIIEPFSDNNELALYPIISLNICLSSVLIVLLLQKLKIDNLYRNF